MYTYHQGHLWIIYFGIVILSETSKGFARTWRYQINPYDPCISNTLINRKQHTVSWLVDDLKFSYVDKKINDEFVK